MPTIITRGAISARNAGAFAYVPPAPVPPVPPPPPGPTPPPPPGPVYQTVQFTSSGSWTCPAGVFYIVNLEVYGGMYSSTPGQWVSSGSILFVVAPGTTQAGNPASFWTYEGVNNYVNATLANLNSGGYGERTVSFVKVNNYYNSITGGYYNEYESVTNANIRGQAYLSSGPGDNRTSEIVQPTQIWTISYEIYIPPETSNGTPSSAFGYTAAGGTSPDQQFVTTASYVPVTPGQTYSIQVGTSGGSVILQFVQ